MVIRIRAVSSLRRAGARWGMQLLPFLVPLMVIVYFCWGWLSAPTSRVAGDLNHWGWLEGTQYWYWHIAQDLFNGINPFVNNLKAFPSGDNHLILYGNFGDALLAAPLQWLFDFPLSYNLTVLLFTCLNAFGCYRLARVFTSNRLLASVAACIVVLHPHFATQLEQGRLTQYLVGFSLLTLAETAAIMRDRGRKIRMLVFYWVATFVCFWFYGFFVLLFVLAWVLMATRKEPWREKKPFARALLWTVAYSIPFGLPLAWAAGAGGGIQGVEFFTLPVREARWITAAMPRDFFWLRETEFGVAWVPATLLLTAGIGILCGWGRESSDPARRLPPLMLATAIAGVLALGPFLVTAEGGVATLGPPLPWYLLYYGVPFFSRLSYPIMVFPFVLAGLLALSLLAVDFFTSRGGLACSGRWKASVAVLPILIELVVRVQPMATADEVKIPEPYRWLALQEDADAIVEYPFGYTDCACLFQPIHNKCIMGTEGRFGEFQEVGPVAELFDRQPALQALADVQEGEAPTEVSQEDLEKLYDEGFDFLVFRPIKCGKQPVLSRGWIARTEAWLEDMLGPPVRKADGVTIFELPGSGTQESYCGEPVKGQLLRL